MKGPKIKTVDRVCELALERKCVVLHMGMLQNPCRLTAAFVQNWQAVVLYRSIQRGMWEYVPKARRRKA